MILFDEVLGVVFMYGFREQVQNFLKRNTVSSFKLCLLLLIVANLFLFGVFIFINPQMNFFNQLFLYLSSRPFQFVTISFGLPLLIFLIENTFKVREKFFD